jgi:hypothetical protein
LWIKRKAARRRPYLRREFAQQLPLSPTQRAPRTHLVFASSEITEEIRVNQMAVGAGSSLVQIAKYRKLEVRKSLILKYPISGFCLEK